MKMHWGWTVGIAVVLIVYLGYATNWKFMRA